MTDAPRSPEPPAPDRSPAAVVRTQAARDAAAGAHLGAFFNVIPLLGVFTAIGVFRTQRDRSLWAARQALQAAMFQFLTFNVALGLVTTVVVIAVFAWESTYSDGSLALAVFLTALPFYVAYYVVQGLAALRAAAAVRRGEDYRYPIAGRLMGPPAP